MNCITTTTTGPCNPCEHPIDYLFDLVETGLSNGGNTVPAGLILGATASSVSFAQVLDRILDKGYVNTNCDLCCPGCGGLYVLANVETFLKAWELTIIGSNLVPCCNGFTECVDDLICDLTNDPNTGLTGSEIEDRLLDKGIVEYGNFVNNCTTASFGTEVCRIKDFIKSLYESTNEQDSTLAEIWDRITDKGIAVACYQGTIVIASVETFLKWAEFIGFSVSSNKTCCSNAFASVETYLKYIEAVSGGGAVPAIAASTTTTTTTTV